MVVYLDSLALLNFIINYLLLLAAARIGGGGFRRIRLLLGAFFGAMYAVFCWVPPVSSLLNNLPAKLLCGIGMAAIAFAGVRWGRFLRLCAFMWAAAFLLGGIVLALGMLSGNPATGAGIPYMPVDFKVLFLTAALCYLILTLVFRHMGRHGPGEAADVKIAWETRHVHIKALVDTGHTLTDPLSGNEVMILEFPRAAALLPDAAALLVEAKTLQTPVMLLEALGELGYGARFRLIPYRVMGHEASFLLAFRPDHVLVDGVPRRACLVGLAPTPIEAGAGIEGLVSAR